MTMSDDRLIVALDVPNIIAGLDLVKQLGTSVSFYKIGLFTLVSNTALRAKGCDAEMAKSCRWNLTVDIL